MTSIELTSTFSGWWLNHPSEKMLVKLHDFPKDRGEHEKYWKPRPGLFPRRCCNPFRKRTCLITNRIDLLFCRLGPDCSCGQRRIQANGWYLEDEGRLQSPTEEWTMELTKDLHILLATRVAKKIGYKSSLTKAMIEQYPCLYHHHHLDFASDAWNKFQRYHPVSKW